MELQELGNRIFRLHAKLIVACLVAGAVLGSAVHLGEKPLYQATVRLVIGAPDPQSAQQAAVLADTARAIATGPVLVSRSISSVGARRSELEVQNAISVQTLGSSGTLALTVNDRDPRVAVELANAIAEGLVATRANLTHSSVASSLQHLNDQEKSVEAQILALNAQAQRLAAQVATTPPNARNAGVAVALLNGAQARLTSLQELANQLTLQQNSLSAELGPPAAIIDRAQSAVAAPGRTLDDAALGGLLGLVVGIGIAAARETVRPSVVGAQAIAEAMGAPLLGETSALPDTWTTSAPPEAASYIAFAAQGKRLQEVRFAVLEPNQGHARVRVLDGAQSRMRVHTGGGRWPPLLTSADPARAPSVSLVLDGGTPTRTGLVVVVRRVIKAADMAAVSNFLSISGWPLLGVIVFNPPRNSGMAKGGSLITAGAEIAPGPKTDAPQTSEQPGPPTTRDEISLNALKKVEA